MAAVTTGSPSRTTDCRKSLNGVELTSGEPVVESATNSQAVPSKTARVVAAISVVNCRSEILKQICQFRRAPTEPLRGEFRRRSDGNQLAL